MKIRKSYAIFTSYAFEIQRIFKAIQCPLLFKSYIFKNYMIDLHAFNTIMILYLFLQLCYVITFMKCGVLVL